MADEEYEVIWNGGELLPPRDQRPDPSWKAPKRKWTRRVTDTQGQVSEGMEDNDDDTGDGIESPDTSTGVD